MPRPRLVTFLLVGIAAVVALGALLLLGQFGPRDGEAFDRRTDGTREAADGDDADDSSGSESDASGSRIVRMRGRVVDELGRAVPEATVSARNRLDVIRDIDWLNLARHGAERPVILETTATDENGGFEFETLADGVYVVHAVAEGFAPTVVNDAVANAESVPPEFEIRLGRGHPVAGVVVDREQLPVKGAWVAIDGAMGFANGFQGREAVQTGEDGRFLFPAVRQGTDYVLNVRAKGYPASFRFGLKVPTKRDVVVRLSGSAVLTGRVSDERGAPVAGADVLVATGLPIVSYDVTTTGADGSYRFEHLGAGAVLGVTVTKTGFSPYPEGALGRNSMPSVALRSGETERFDVTLRRGAALVGTVRDAGGAPVANASVRVLSGGVSFLTTKGGLTTTTDDSGNFRVTGLSVGRNVVSASRDGFTQDISMEEMFSSMGRRPGSGPGGGEATPNVVYVQPGDVEVSIDIVLQEAASITGIVLAPDGKPVAGATVGLGSPEDAATPFRRMMDVTGGSNAQTRTDESGRFVLEPIHAGEIIKIHATAEGYSPAVADAFPLAPGETVENVELVLKIGSLISGVVMSEDGAPIVGARVRTAPANLEWSLTFGEGDPNPVTTDEEGRFEKSVPLTGTIVVRADADGFSATTLRNIEVKPDESVDGLEIGMKRALRIAGFIFGPDGKPAADVSVRANAQGNSAGVRFDRFEVITAADGSFLLEGLRPGPYRIRTRTMLAPEEELRDVAAGTLDVSITLKPGLRISGHLLGPSGEPVGGVSIRARRNGRGSSGVRTNAAGEFVFANLEVGTWSLRYEPEATDPGSYLTEELKGIDTGTDDVVMRLRPGWVISGVVLDATGRAVPNASVGILQGRDRRSSSTDLKGRFLFRGLPDGTWKLTASSLDGLSGSLDGVASGASAVVLSLETAAKIEGRVVLPGNKSPGISLFVSAVPEGEERAVAFVATGEDGKFVLENLPKGVYTLQCRDESRGLAGTTLVKAGSPATIVLKPE